LKSGDAEIGRVTEVDRHPSRSAIPPLPPEILSQHQGWLLPHFYDTEKDVALLSVHSWLVRVDGKTILIDPCAGNHKPRNPGSPFHMMDTPYLENLRQAGAAPEDIDAVFCTHLHTDHCGWNTLLENGVWVPTFPNARYYMPRIEYEFWRGSPDDPKQAGGASVMNDSVAPIVASGQHVFIEGSETIAGCLVLDPTPGHTPGHVSALLDTGKDRVLFAGDVLHHPLQIYYPEWTSRFCTDPDLSRLTRKRVLARCADQNLILAPAHFRTPHMARVAHDGMGGFVPVWQTQTP